MLCPKCKNELTEVCINTIFMCRFCGQQVLKESEVEE
jgi:ribosomal protein L37AE/L43A